MTGVRELLAVVLGAALGVAALAAPRTALRLSVFGGPSRRRRGDYGADAAVSDRSVWVVRALGLVCLLVSATIAAQTFL
jgi:hypothetical protein